MKLLITILALALAVSCGAAEPAQPEPLPPIKVAKSYTPHGLAPLLKVMAAHIERLESKGAELESRVQELERMRHRHVYDQRTVEE